MRTKNTMQQGVPQNEALDQLPVAGGLPVHGGVPKVTEQFLAEQGEWRGIPMPGPAVIAEGSVKMVSVPWLMQHVADSFLEGKQAEDSEGLEKAMTMGASIPPIHVVVNENGAVSLLDGHHRLVVADDIGWKEIRAIVEGELPTAVKCTATTKKGNPCKAYAVTDSTLCVGHK